MEDQEMGVKAKELRERALRQKKSEPEDVTKDRMRKVLSDRDQAMRMVYDYQNETGIPSEEDAAENFFENETSN
jgi:hypothetical protein